MLRRWLNRRTEPKPVLSLDGDSLSYMKPDGSGWRTLLQDIVAIGEETNENGPSVDDYFFWFVRSNDLLCASFYSDGRDETLRKLDERLGLAPVSLVNSTTFASRVLWPGHLAGKPLWQYSTDGNKVNSVLTPAVLSLTSMTAEG